ncbi:uncharacterized protein LOC108622086 isoform X2 [Ceratina calcarata]|uniref:Uncharacterized protein LOC108622086 isoform X2 n=1 Tax=Ceratina calcarata TaxID=156304 RepID=A0AAJ7W967_9HYME|nr:uncharacterized protein LOC108622086 isoform X2 [Ceratina calcarata]
MSVCHEDTCSKQMIPVQITHESRPRTTEELFKCRKYSSIQSSVPKYNRVQDRYSVRTCPKNLREEIRKSRSKKGTTEDKEIKDKRHSKSANNVKTDNRRMTGNVNIYICSEATENTQVSKKEKKVQQSSSETTTTERSKISSSKLVTRIKNRRRKQRAKELSSFECVSKKEESSDNSTTCSYVTKYTESKSATRVRNGSYIDVCNNLDNDICVKETESTLSDCECQHANISDTIVEINKSDLSFERSKFVICDKVEKPCSTIYPTKSMSNSESEEWSSKSICSSSRNADYVPCDTWSLEPNYRTTDTEKSRKPKRTLDLCKYHIKDRESITRCVRCNCKTTKHFSKVEKEPWIVCNCITEEEEGEVSVKPDTDREEEKITVCRKRSGDVKLEPRTKDIDHLRDSKEELEDVDSKDAKISEGEVEEDTDKAMHEDNQEKLSTTPETKLLVPFAPRRLIRPETRVLQTLLRQVQSVKPVAPPKQDAQPKSKPVSPNILRKFHLPKHYTLLGQSLEKETSIEETGKEVTENKKVESKETSEDKNDSKDKDTKNFPERVRGSFLYKGLKKMIGKTEQSVTRAEKSGEGEDDGIIEPISDNTNIDIPEIEADKSESVVKSNEIKGTNKEKEKKSKLFSYVPMMIKKDKSEKNVVTSENSSKNERKENKSSNKTDPANLTDPIDTAASNPTDDLTESTKEETKTINTINKDGVIPDAIKEKQDKSKLAVGKIALPDQDQHTDDVLSEKENEEPPKTHDPQETNKKRELHESLRKSQVRKASNVEEERLSVTRKPQVRKGSGVEEKKLSVSREPAIQEQKPTKNMYSEEEPVTACTEPYKLQSRTYISSKPSSKPYTICTNSKYVKQPTINESTTVQENTCNCCCPPTTLRNVTEPISHPKSCLKKERQCCHSESQETTSSTPYHDKKNWEGCGCRRIISCNGCCRPRNECSCRRTVICTVCYKPKNKCHCKSMYETKSNQKTDGYMKSMFCLYCDNPRDKCTCRAPIRKCSCCDLSGDLCLCKDQKSNCDGRPVLTEPENSRTMYVTAWKPREEVRRYFSRNLADLRTDSINECCCCEKLKPHNSDDLPYQRLSVFSDVMDELQQKMSESICCARCKKIPCCCNVVAERDEGREDRKIKYCISCIAARERNKPRPCRCTDSPCRAKEKESLPCGKTFIKPKSNDEKTICVR